jgi:hypothetical protein
MDIRPRFKIQYPMKNRCKYRTVTAVIKAPVDREQVIID